MRLLIYGFGPYRIFQQNVTEKILEKLPNRRFLRKLVFPVEFNKNQFVNAVKDYKPDVILGLGQCARGRLLRVEARAVNQWRVDIKNRPRTIIKGVAPKLLTTLNLDLIQGARVSYDAGNYVCNYSMYVVLDYLSRRRPEVRFGFIHIPHGYDPEKAARLLLKAILNFQS